MVIPTTVLVCTTVLAFEFLSAKNKISKIYNINMGIKLAVTESAIPLLPANIFN